MAGEGSDPELRRVTCEHRPTLTPKFEIINKLIAHENLSCFEYIVVIDDDIGLPDEFLDRFLKAQRQLQFALAQPARTPDSYIDHPIVRQQQEVFGRATRWVEVGPLVSIHRSIYDIVIPFDLMSPMGWGYENVWALQLLQRGAKMGIIDAYPVQHRLRKPHLYYDWTEANAAQSRLLASRKHLPLPECQRVLEVFPYKSEQRTVLNPRPYETSSSSETKQLVKFSDGLSGAAYSVLDWHTGLDLASLLPDCLVVTPESNGSTTLPYFDKSFDVVLIEANRHEILDEGRRIAKLALVQTDRAHGCYSSITSKALPPGASVSVIIPTYDGAKLTENCVHAVLATLPGHVDVEVMVVDDGSKDNTQALMSSLSKLDSRVRLVASTASRQGFSEACNRGALAARGKILVFLNNDTTPHRGWLETLLETFRRYPDAGAVGGKLLHPDGRLQEAGSMIFADGSAANVGNGENGDLPVYNHVRKVDYCSAAFLATPRQLFEDLGLFDLRYSPAYYEDTDYCFKVRTRGMSVYYQPRCVITHIGGATAGSDPSHGMKRYQSLNKERFFQKWHNMLTHQFDCPADLSRVSWRRLVSRRSAVKTPRVLVCAPTLPEFDRESGSRRILSHVEAIRALGGSVVFVAETGDPRGRYASCLQQMGVETHCSSSGLTNLLREDKFDIGLFAFWHVAEKYMPHMRTLCKGAKVVVDSVDLHFLRNGRRLDRAWDYRKPREISLSHSAEMRRELAVYQYADAVLTVSEEETKILRSLLGSSAYPVTIPDEEHENVDQSNVPWQQRRGMLFLGNFRHPPNVEAVLYFVHEVLPLIPANVLKSHPLYVVGNALPPEFKALAASMTNVKLVGWVPDVNPYLARSRVLIAPLLHGAGTKRKLIQALFAGLPIVASDVAAEGLGLSDGKEFILANDPRMFASAVTRVIGNAELSNELASCGRATVEQKHSQQQAHAALRHLFCNLRSKSPS